jgi:predicted DNA-binding protein
MQATIVHITLSKTVKRELERRKKILSKQTGRKVSFDYVLRNMIEGLKLC